MFVLFEIDLVFFVDLGKLIFRCRSSFFLLKFFLLVNWELNRVFWFKDICCRNRFLLKRSRLFFLRFSRMLECFCRSLFFCNTEGFFIKYVFVLIVLFFFNFDKRFDNLRSFIVIRSFLKFLFMEYWRNVFWMIFVVRRDRIDLLYFFFNISICLFCRFCESS